MLLFCAACTKAPEPTPVALPPAAKDGSPVVAMVGEEAITLASLQVIAAQNGYNLQLEGDRELALRDAVNNEILAAKARELGYEDDPDIRRYVKTQAVQKRLLATVDKEHQGAVPSDQELKDYFEAHQAEFTPPTVAKAQVLALLRRDGQDAEFKAKLAEVREAVTANQVPFGELVERYLDDPSAKAYAGMTNWLVKGEANKQYPEALLQAVFEAADTQTVVGPIEHKEWVYFVKVAEKREGQATAFEQAKPRISQQLIRKRRLDAYNAFVEQLEKDVPVQTFPDAVKQGLEASLQSDGPPPGPVPTPASK